MATESTFTKFVSLVDVTEATAQNVQELASIWGEIDNELAEIGVEVEESYAVLGEVDFIVVFEAPNNEAAFKADVVLERHGLDVQTMEITPTSEFSAFVHDM